MAPIHHHFEMKAWSETKIMVRFWIVGAILLHDRVRALLPLLPPLQALAVGRGVALAVARGADTGRGRDRGDGALGWDADRDAARARRPASRSSSHRCERCSPASSRSRCSLGMRQRPPSARAADAARDLGSRRLRPLPGHLHGRAAAHLGAPRRHDPRRAAGLHGHLCGARRRGGVPPRAWLAGSCRRTRRRGGADRWAWGGGVGCDARRRPARARRSAVRVGRLRRRRDAAAARPLQPRRRPSGASLLGTFVLAPLAIGALRTRRRAARRGRRRGARSSSSRS